MGMREPKVIDADADIAPGRDVIRPPDHRALMGEDILPLGLKARKTKHDRREIRIRFLAPVVQTFDSVQLARLNGTFRKARRE